MEPDTSLSDSAIHLAEAEKKIEKLTRRNCALLMQIYRMRKKTNTRRLMKPEAGGVLTKRTLGELENLLKDHLNDSQLQFVMSQIRASGRSIRGRRWTTGDKALSLSLLHSSPKTYRLLRKIFALPSVQTLRKIMSNLNLYPGFNKCISEALRLKVDKLPPSARLVSLAMDEMAIKRGVSYDGKRDEVEGFAGMNLADHALVFVARGILHRWKQPFGFFFSSGVMSGAAMQPLLLEAIQHLNDIGLTVAVVVSDQGSNNINLFQTRLKISAERPYFMCGEQKVFVIYDPPHLIKNIRNNLKNHGFEVDGKDILWQHILDFYNKDASKPTRLAPKLTERHLKLPPFSTLKVKLAAQVISHSVASGMKVMVQWEIIDKEAYHTADFLERFDRLFNSFNSSTVSSTSAMKHALSGRSGHLEFLAETLNWLGTIKSKGSRMPQCVMGWKIAINALLQLWHMLANNHGVKFLLTRQLNQDTVENLFSVIRAKGGARDNPTVSQFRAALQQVMVDMVMQKGNMSNCEEDVDRFLISLTNSYVADKNPIVEVTKIVPDATIQEENCPPDVRSLLNSPLHATELADLSLKEKNVLAYIAGFLVRRVAKKACSNCCQKIKSELSGDNPNHDFMAVKQLEGAKEGLVIPSTVLVDSLQKMEVQYSRHVETLIHQDHVKAAFVALLVDCVDEQLVCNTCNLHKMIACLMVNVRLFHTLRLANAELRDTQNRKNRKAIKFGHL